MLTIADSVHQLETKTGEEATHIANDPSHPACCQEYMASVLLVTTSQPDNLHDLSFLCSKQSHPHHLLEIVWSLIEVLQGDRQKNALSWSHQRQ